MKAVKGGLCEAADFMGEEPGSADALEHAGSLASQSAGIALLCSIALDAAAYGGCGQGCDPAEVAGIASRLMHKCWNDLTVAVDIMQ